MKLRRSASSRVERRVLAAVDIGADHRDQVARRIASALRLVDGSSETERRIAGAPAGYLLTHGGNDIARHAAMLEPCPNAGELRVVATPGRSADTWNLDIATLDRPGLLAVFSGGLVHAGIDIVQAVVATWDDGAALQALVVRGLEPDTSELQRSLAWALSQPLSAPPVSGAIVTFDSSASPHFTTCDVVAPDRPGLLHAVAVAIANAGADIHAASVRTTDGIARDRFDLSDNAGRQLTPSIEAAITANVGSGFGGLVGARRGRD